MTTRDEILKIVNEAATLRLQREGHNTEPMLRRALAMAEEAFGPDSEEMIAPLEELARVLHLRAGCSVADPEGLELNERAYAIATRFPGPDNRRLAYVMDSLGDALTNTPDGLERGLELMRNALSLVQGNERLAHRESWMTMGLAHTLMLRERYSEALPYARRFVELEGRGQPNFMYGHALITLGQALLGAGDFGDAIHYLGQAKAFAEQLGRQKWVDAAQRLIDDARQRLQALDH